jgi:tetratricopeptide (TPR) repeat protein
MAGLANVAYLKGEFAVAVKLYEECLEHGVKGALAPTVYARALCYSRRLEDALAVFHELNSTNGSSATTLNDIGMTLVMLGRPREALDYGLRALDLDPMYRFAWDTVGFAHLKMGQYAESIPKFLKAIELEPNYPDAWRHLLHAYHGAGQTKELIGAQAWVGDILPGELARFEKEKGTELLD